MPAGEVRVLRGRIGKRNGAPGGEGEVRDQELAEEDAHRPTVTDDMVKGEDHDVLAAMEMNQRQAKQWSTLQIEGTLRLGGDGPPELLLPAGVGQVREIDYRRLQAELGGDALYRPSIHLGERRSKNFVPAHDLVQR